MNYSIVDLSLNGGLGDITLKNQFLFAPSTEGMAATMNCTRDSIWVVGHEYGTNAFYAYLIAKNGLNTTPVVSNVGATINGNPVIPICISPNGKKIAHATELLDFDVSTGKISNDIFVPIIAGYGTSFSPNSKKLYSLISGSLIVQVDATLNNTTNILNSLQYIYQGVSNDEYWGLQLGNDYKIYIAAQDTSKISTIDYPNNIGGASGFNPYSVDLNGRKSQFTFPSFIESYFDDSYNENNCYDITQDSIIIPNIFTPNNDDINDVFSIRLIGYKNITWKIYNRWGVEMINGELENLNTTTVELWDGRTNSGTKALEGTYYYIISLTPKEGENKTKKGFITLTN